MRRGAAAVPPADLRVRPAHLRVRPLVPGLGGPRERQLRGSAPLHRQDRQDRARARCCWSRRSKASRAPTTATARSPRAGSAASPTPSSPPARASRAAPDRAGPTSPARPSDVGRHRPRAGHAADQAPGRQHDRQRPRHALQPGRAGPRHAEHRQGPARALRGRQGLLRRGAASAATATSRPRTATCASCCSSTTSPTSSSASRRPAPTPARAARARATATCRRGARAAAGTATACMPNDPNDIQGPAGAGD